MHAFTDAVGREWQLRITIGAAERLKESELAADLLALEQGEPPLSTRLALDHPFRFHCLFVLLEHQAKQHGVDDAAFCEALDATAVAEATNAFWEELLDFFRGLERTDLVKLLEAQKNVIETGVNHNRRQVERNLGPALERMIAEAMKAAPPTSGNTSGAPPGSSDRTPDPSLSASSIGH